MQILLQEHRRLLKRLVEAKVEFILIGGYAVIYHGYPRTTDDLDIWVKPDNTNKEKLMTFFANEGIRDEDVETLREMDFTSTHVFFLGEAPYQIDFLTKVQGLNFGEAQKLQVYFDIDGLKIPVLNIDHLVISKILSDRPKDKADLDELQKIIRMRKKN
ncbi:MAG TPA: nucleotidyltransferase [Chitinophagales bacterium]|nr:nucleotidyltransferase [Chitinophagales bacterium]